MSAVEPESQIAIAEISPTDYPKLLQFGVPEFDHDSLAKGDQRYRGIVSLLKESQIETGAVALETREFQLTIPGQPSNLAEYFKNFAQFLQDSVDASSQRPVGRNSLLVLNLLPFYLSTSRVDKILNGLLAQKTILNRFHSVVFLLRNIDWLLKSSVFKGSWAMREWPTSVWAIDIRCYVTGFVVGSENINSRISRTPFRLLLDTDHQRLYKSLIYETNSYIGHFVLKDSHVRTHYDLSEYIRRDNVWEFLHEKFVNEIGNARRVLVFGIGMENAAIARMGEQLRALLGEELDLVFLPASDSLPREVISPQWSRDYDLAVVITDIVNTGKTVEPWVAQLRTSSQGKPVKVFSVARMQNSPNEIAGAPFVAGIAIRRKYYPPTDCVLCKIKQRPVEINKTSDFHTITAEQLTPYDFWEMIRETRALKRSAKDVRGRPLLYRIDTQEIVRRYGGWLANIIRHRYDDNFPMVRASAICTVAEAPSTTFARLVARALHVQQVFEIERRDLERVTPSGLPSDVNSPFGTHENILIVDDGINYGETMRRLISFCRAANALPMGALVLDSRLDLESGEKIAALMGRRPLVALYTWPAISRGLGL